MKRRLLIVAVLLLAGAVVNVVVASLICWSVASASGVKSYNVAVQWNGFSFSVQTSNAGTHSKPVGTAGRAFGVVCPPRARIPDLRTRRSK